MLAGIAVGILVVVTPTAAFVIYAAMGEKPPHPVPFRTSNAEQAPRACDILPFRKARKS